MNLTRTLILIAGVLLTGVASAADSGQNYDKATFAGGCFWCTEADFEKVPGVISAVSGYTGGAIKNPTYKQVSSGRTSHIEAVEIIFDPAKVSFEELLVVFWRNVDPTVEDRQFCDGGKPYQSHIWYHNEAQRQLAEASKIRIEKTKSFSEPILTPITKAAVFWEAEGYHQDYYKKNPWRYKFYRASCGRDKRLEALWGKQG